MKQSFWGDRPLLCGCESHQRVRCRIGGEPCVLAVGQWCSSWFMVIFGSTRQHGNIHLLLCLFAVCLELHLAPERQHDSGKFLWLATSDLGYSANVVALLVSLFHHCCLVMQGRSILLITGDHYFAISLLLFGHARLFIQSPWLPVSIATTVLFSHALFDQ